MKHSSKQVKGFIDVNWNDPRTRLSFHNSYTVNEMLYEYMKILKQMEKEELKKETK